MQALLLAAGRSKRFFPLPDKNFLKLGDKTLIEYQVAAVEKAGIKKIIIVGSAHNVTELGKLFPKATIVEQHELDDGMAGAVLAAREHLTEATVILSTNDMFDPAAIKKVASTRKGSGTILARKVESYFPGGYLTLEKTGRVTSIVEKPGAGAEPSEHVNIVCHLHRDPAALVAKIEENVEEEVRSFFGAFGTKPGKRDDVYELALAELFATHDYYAVSYTGTWHAVKYPWHALDAATAFLKSIRKKKPRTVQIAKTATVSGTVHFGDGVRVMDSAVIVGPCYIGAHTVIGTGSLVRESVVGAHCIVGSHSEVARSLLGSDVWLHRNYVGDSVLADNVSFGAGATTGNLRLDEKDVVSVIRGEKISTERTKYGVAIGRDCRLGVNVNTMPGVGIGENTFISSGLIIDSVIPAHSFVKGETKLEIRENKGSAPKRR